MAQFFGMALLMKFFRGRNVHGLRKAMNTIIKQHFNKQHFKHEHYHHKQQSSWPKKTTVALTLFTAGSTVGFSLTDWLHTGNDVSESDRGLYAIRFGDSDALKALRKLAAAEDCAVPFHGALEANTDTIKFARHEPEYEFERRIERLLRGTQARIVANIEKLEEEAANREGAGAQPVRVDYSNSSATGIRPVLQDGRVFEKAAVSLTFSHRPDVPHGFWERNAPDHSEIRKLVESGQLPTEPVPFFTGSMSLILHPRNPFAPTVHANYRFFQFEIPGRAEPIWYFGGGTDLTPSLLNNDDAVHFHRTLKTALDASGDKSLYPSMKAWCDRYFYLPWRKESRGIGGIFYDDFHDKPVPLSPTPAKSKEQIFDIMSRCCESFCPSYFPLVQQHQYDMFTEADRRWQLIRRGRYVEFNLLADRGTRYGFEMNHPAELLLVSLPLNVRFETGMKPLPGLQSDTMRVLREPKQWA